MFSRIRYSSQFKLFSGERHEIQEVPSGVVGWFRWVESRRVD